MKFRERERESSFHILQKLLNDTIYIRVENYYFLLFFFFEVIICKKKEEEEEIQKQKNKYGKPTTRYTLKKTIIIFFFFFFQFENRYIYEREAIIIKINKESKNNYNIERKKERKKEKKLIENNIMILCL